jgi:hypothetical protein
MYKRGDEHGVQFDVDILQDIVESALHPRYAHFV